MAALPSKLVSMFFAERNIDRVESRYFDAWRGGSAVMVLIGHAVDIAIDKPEPVTGISSSLAVLAFFGLSGFFIHKSLAKSFGRHAHGAFIRSRINRILPPFLLALALTIALWMVAPLIYASGTRTFLTPTVRSAFSLDGLLPTALFLNGFAGPTLSADDPLWSLSYEVWYYVLAFLLALAMMGRVVGFIALPILVTLTFLNPAFLLLGIPWALGFLLSILHANDMIPNLPQWPFWLAAAVFAGPIVMTQDTGILWTLFRVVFGVAFVVHLSQTLRTERSPAVPLLPATAAFSYTLYVIHYPILLFAYGATEGASPAVLLLVAAAVLAFAAIIGPRIERMRIFPERARQTAKI